MKISGNVYRKNFMLWQIANNLQARWKMSIVKLCPYDMEEHCKYEIYYGEPMFSKCKNCEIKNNRRHETKNKGVVMTEKEIELFNKCGNLEAENENLKLRLKNFEENVIRIITNFWCWYVSGNHKRDLSAKEEGEKYANNFFHDLIQEADEIKE